MPEPLQFTVQHTIETPEQTGIDFALAGIGSRFLAILIDTAVQAGVALGMAFLLAALRWVFGFSGLRGAGLWATALTLFGYFLLLYGYFAIFEILWNGQTPGKRAIGIRVIKESGRPLTAVESIGRNLMRILDMLPFFYAGGLVAMMISKRNKRLGDMVAGSIVIRERTAEDLRPEWNAPTTGRVPPADLAVIDTFLSRRYDMTMELRERMAEQILERVRANAGVGADDDRSAETILESLVKEGRA